MFSLAMVQGAASAEPEKKDPPKPQAVSGVVELFNLSPKGPYDSVLLKNDGKVIQVVFPKESSEAVVKLIKVGETIESSAVSEEAKGKHPVFKAQSLKNAKGEKLEFAEKAKEPENKPKVETPKPTGPVVTLKGKIARLNLTKNGEVNGGILESGDFVHTGPKLAKELNLAVGQEISSEGIASATASGKQVIEKPTRVNGKEIVHEKKPEESKDKK